MSSFKWDKSELAFLNKHKEEIDKITTFEGLCDFYYKIRDGSMDPGNWDWENNVDFFDYGDLKLQRIITFLADKMGDSEEILFNLVICPGELEGYGPNDDVLQVVGYALYLNEPGTNNWKDVNDFWGYNADLYDDLEYTEIVDLNCVSLEDGPFFNEYIKTHNPKFISFKVTDPEVVDKAKEFMSNVINESLRRGDDPYLNVVGNIILKFFKEGKISVYIRKGQM